MVNVGPRAAKSGNHYPIAGQQRSNTTDKWFVDYDLNKTPDFVMPSHGSLCSRYR